MRIVSFNINGIRARQHQLQLLKERYDPDIIGIQETKVQDQDFPIDMIEELGYRAYYFGQKSHYGVALLSKVEPLSLSNGFPFDPDDAQRRLISAVYETEGGQRFTLINGYFPQGENRDHEIKFPAKRKFYNDMMVWLNEQFDPQERLLIIGDMNIAPVELDVGIGAENAKRWLRTGKCCFLPEEREWMTTLTDWGLEDCYRKIYPDVDDQFSWFDYRSRGFDREPKRGLRIDLILGTSSIVSRCHEVGIAYDIRGMEKPSDHCPVWADFGI